MVALSRPPPNRYRHQPPPPALRQLPPPAAQGPPLCLTVPTQQTVRLLDGTFMQGLVPQQQVMPPSYTPPLYDHALISHATGQLRLYGSLKRFGAWHVEHCNRWWKHFLQSRGGGHESASPTSNLAHTKPFGG